MKRIPEFLLALSWFAAGVSIAADPPRTPAPAPEPAVTPPVVTLPDKLSAEPREWVIVSFKASASAGTPKFYLPDPGLSRVALESLFGDEMAAKAKGIVVRADQPGVYRIVGYCGSASGAVSEPAVCTITIGIPPPPTPPQPPPTPPPTDPFARAVWDAYQLETAATKASDASAWAGIFRGAIAHVDNPSVKTNADLHADLKAALASTRPGALPRVKPVITNEITIVFGREPTKTIDKTIAKAELEKIATALGGLR
jgi:hypothetical protein